MWIVARCLLASRRRPHSLDLVFAGVRSNLGLFTWNRHWLPGRVPHVRNTCPGVPWGVRGPEGGFFECFTRRVTEPRAFAVNRTLRQDAPIQHSALPPD